MLDTHIDSKDGADIEAATRFLNALDPNAETFCFQTFAERNGSRGGKRIDGPLANGKEVQLDYLNEQGHGIAVTINETNGKGRKAADITRIRSIWLDDDDGYEGEYPLQPSIIVETSPGRFHFYWFIEDDWPCDDAGKENFEGVMRRLVADYGHDPRATDLSRAMRLPGFYHLKGERWLTRIIETFLNDNGEPKRYSRRQILEAFPPIAGQHERSADDGGDDEGLEVNPERIEDALGFIKCDDYQDWFLVACGLHHCSGGSDEGYGLLDEWSRGSANYDQEKNRVIWDGLGGHADPITVAALFAKAKQNGWTDEAGRNLPCEHKPNEFPVTWLQDDGPLAQATMNSTARQFEKWGHNPSDDHRKGLLQICGAIEGMANGTLEPNFYLSSLPPGMGKTTTLTHAVRNLSQVDGYKDKKVIIFLFRLEEIRKLVSEMGLSENEYSVLTSDDDMNKLGNQDKQAARVMFTTQQMLESRCKKHSSFEAMSDFHYRGDFDDTGRVREIRVWDEAILPAMTVTLERRAIGKLTPELQLVNRELADELEDFMMQLRNEDDHALVTVPNVKSAFGISESAARDVFKRSDDKDLVSILWMLSGRTVRIRKDQFENTVLDYKDILPEDLGPLLIMDASGLQRKTYKHWFNERKNLAYLHSPQKRYTNLTIHLWQKGSSARSYATDKDRVLIDGLARTLNEEVPCNHKVLVVHFKENKAKKVPDIPNEVRKRLVSDPLHMAWEVERVHFLNYGRHTATNDYQDFKYVVLSGVYGYPTSAIEAMARGAKKIDAETDLSTADFDEIKLGEIAHNTYQAANRGMMRKADGDDCPEGCHLYVIASSQSGVPAALPQIFPGAKIVEWKPMFKPSDKIKKAGDYIIAEAEAGYFEIRDRKVMMHVLAEGGDNNKSNFNRTVLHHEDLQRYLDEAGWLYDKAWGKVKVRRKD